jgi:hypothetical protein
MKMRTARAAGLALALAALAVMPLSAAANRPANRESATNAAGVRTIATIALDTWFDGSFRVKMEDVMLVGLLPALTLEARVAREDVAGWHGWQFGLGPVVNLTPNLYLIALYTLGIDSDSVFSHEIDASLNRETATTAVSLGLKADWFPSLGYFYATPSLGGKFHPVAALGLFGKVFVTVDSDGDVSGSFWGEADWSVTPAIALRAGGTMGYSGEFGWSAIAGVNVAITPRVLLKYTFKYLAEPVDALPGEPVRNGIENGLVLDVRF